MRKLPSKKLIRIPHAENFDIVLFLLTIVLVLFGLLLVYNASSVIAEKNFSDKYHFLKDQATWAILGFIAMTIVSFIDYHVWQKLAVPILAGTFVLLVAVFLPGIGIRVLGASRWINLGFSSLQPAEFAKLALCIYLSAWFSTKEQRKLSAFLILLAVFIGLVMLEPDMGTSIVLASLSIILYFFSGANIIQFFFFAPIGAILAFILIKIEPYRFARFTTFLNPESDPLGASYHIRQTLFALGNGGLFGLGVGQSRQKYAYLPESTTDSIFAILAEELGFIGGATLIFIFFFFALRGFTIARNAKDTFGSLLAAGITSYLIVQVIINLSAQVALLPFTGIPLPFLSYGGSSLVVNLTAVGILLNISRSMSSPHIRTSSHR